MQFTRKNGILLAAADEKCMKVTKKYIALKLKNMMWYVLVELIFFTYCTKHENSGQ